jgi:5'-nucleotidase
LTCPERSILNVNIPAAGAPAGFRRADLATFGAVQASVAGHDEEFVRMDIAPIAGDARPGTDVALLAEGYGTVTPLTPVADPRDAEVDRLLEAWLT